MEENIRIVRDKLYTLLEENGLDSECVLEVSRELDELIVMYYCRCYARV